MNLSRNYILSGITELLVLFFLSKRDSYIYELTQAISVFSEGCIELAQNTVYAVAYKLEREKKITEYSKVIGKKRTRVYYHLEESGKIYLEEQLEVFRNVIDGTQMIFKCLTPDWRIKNE